MRPGQPTDDSFGYSASVSGKSILLGANNEDGTQKRAGAAYVFAGEQWADVTRLSADEETAYAGFGHALALDGDTAFVGLGGLEKTPVYVFGKSGGKWAMTQKLREDASDTFGFRIKVRGNVAMIAAPKDSADIGKIHMYTKAGATWTEQQEIVANDGAIGDFFALGMDFDGQSLISSEPATNSKAPVPAAYIFVKNGTSFVQQAKLVLSKVSEAVAISGDTAVVGIPAPVGSGQARVTIYIRSGDSWSVQQELTMPSEELFGTQLAIQGDVLFVSAETGGRSSVYVYRRTGQVWAQTQQLSVVPAELGPRALAVGGGTLAVGISNNTLTGAAQVFRDPAEDAKAPSSSNGDQEKSGCSFSKPASGRHTVPSVLLGGVLLLLLSARRRRVARRDL